MLSVASATAELVEHTVGIALANAFECAAAPPRKSPYPDRQTRQVGLFLEKYFDEKAELRVLDYGAGVGRTVIEVRKTEAARQIFWTLYEPENKNSTKLVEDFKIDPMVSVIDSMQELNGENMDVALLTNVLHVLDAHQIADTVTSIHRSILAKKGFVLASEIYPLLLPEKSAVPLPMNHLVKFFRRLGFAVEAQEFEAGGCLAYCLAARVKESDQLQEAMVRQVAEEMWDSILVDFLESYSDAGRVTSLDDQRKLLNWAFGIARIQAAQRLGGA